MDSAGEKAASRQAATKVKDIRHHVKEVIRQNYGVQGIAPGDVTKIEYYKNAQLRVSTYCLILSCLAKTSFASTTPSSHIDVLTADEGSHLLQCAGARVVAGGGGYIVEPMIT